LPLLLNFDLEYAIRGVQVYRDGLKLTGTHQLLVHADDIILGGSIHKSKGKRMFTLEQATKAHGGSRGTALLLL